MKGNILEVGAGCGSFTKFYHEKYQSITLTELDKKIFLILNRFNGKKNILISNTLLNFGKNSIRLCICTF